MEDKLPIGYEALSRLGLWVLLSSAMEIGMEPEEAAAKLADEERRVLVLAIGELIGADATEEQIEGDGSGTIDREGAPARRDLRMLALAQLLPANAGKAVTAHEASERLGSAELTVLSLALGKALGRRVPAERLELVKRAAWDVVSSLAVDHPFRQRQPIRFRSEGGNLGESWTMLLAEDRGMLRALLEPDGWPPALPLFAAEVTADPDRGPNAAGSWERFYLVARG